MSFRFIARTLAPLAALAAATALSGCDAARMQISGEEGKPLAELDMTGAPPSELALLGPDTVKVSSGDALKITVEGDATAAEALRFTLKDGTLGVLRKSGSWNADDAVTVLVTMPPPRQIAMLGTGTIEAAALAEEAKISILGSGMIATPSITAKALTINIGGTGTYRAGGTVANLNLSIAGTGNAEMDALKVDTANLTIAGTGNARFASDGEVSARIMGTGDVHVNGRAHCTVKAMGTGKLVCEPSPEAAPAAAK